MAEFTHFKKDGSAVMVDVHEKPDTYRAASATGTIQVSPEVFAAVRDHTAKKGDVLGVARLAGIMGAKKNAELIPLCHIVPLTNCEVTFTTDENTNSITAVCTTSCVGKTGVEMEALTGVSTALLTIYDMCKAMDRGMVIRDIHILEKDGGKSGHYIYQKEEILSMTEKTDVPVFRVGMVTLSDKGYQGEREDKSGPRIKELLPAEQYEVVSMRLLPDERAMIEEELIRLADLEQCDLVLTTGGTGFSMRDVTPEATLAVSGRVAPGIAEAIRAGSMAITKRAMLSRAVSAIRHRTLIINLPGSPKAVEESLGFVLDTLPHALGLLRGTDGECGRS